MSSGFGYKGGPGRCYPVWDQFTICMSTASDTKACDDLRFDYMECLHHKKETLAIKEMKNKATGGKVSSSGH